MNLLIVVVDFPPDCSIYLKQKVMYDPLHRAWTIGSATFHDASSRWQVTLTSISKEQRLMRMQLSHAKHLT
jgi:hypothetical protein